MDKRVDLSIVIPVFNEADTLKELLEGVGETMELAGLAYEVIVVDDHSTDATAKIVKDAAEAYPVVLLQKTEGEPRGKASSLLVGFRQAKAPMFAMIDGDLQYPPHLLAPLYTEAQAHGIAVAYRKTYKSTFMRKAASRLNAFVFGRMLLGLRTDVQSGCKVFRREIIDHLDLGAVSAWSIDIPLVFTARELGYTIGHVYFDFQPRHTGNSKLGFFTGAYQISKSAIQTKFSKRRVYHLPPVNSNTMEGAGLAHKGKRYTTHTTLPHKISAFTTLQRWQRFAIAGLVTAVLGSLIVQPMTAAMGIVAILSTVYFIDVLFNLYLIAKSLYLPPEIQISGEELDRLEDKNLPVYSILCPLYREARVIPQFLSSLAALDWPKDKLDVLLLLEEDDVETIDAVSKIDLPKYVRTVIVPHSSPKTKPKACNYGLTKAMGEYVVVYDAEDIPEPQQLKKAYAAFQRIPESIACLQAKLNYYNPHHNLLTRLFTAEYSLWFDVTLPGLQALETAIPLGGTSNHFRTSILLELHGWDAFNVTEDCDLGARLFKRGYRTAIMDSTTLEEANSNFGNWIRQRSRWIKGYIQTYLVHMRDPISFAKNHGVHALIFQLIVGGKIAFTLINPILWIATISYFTLYALVGPTIEALYPSVIFYMAALSLIFGNFLCIYYYMIGCAKRDHWGLMKYVYLVPFYWLMVSTSAVVALVQLVLKPHYWEKTRHGLHLGAEASAPKHIAWKEFFPKALLTRPEITAGGVLILAACVNNLFGFLYNAYLGRMLPVESFGLVSLLGSFLYLTQIPIGALGGTVTYRSAYLFGKHGKPAAQFWKFVRRRALLVAGATAVVWLLLTPLLSSLFRSDLLAFILFSPVWIISTALFVDNGFLYGNMRFMVPAAMIVVESISKLVFSWILVSTGYTQWIYIVIPLSMTCSLGVAWIFVKRLASNSAPIEDTAANTYFPKRFFAVSILGRVSAMVYLSLDVVLAKYFLAPTEAGQYALLSLAGKMVFFVGLLFSQFITPMVSREEGAGNNSQRIFYKLLGITSLACLAGFLAFGAFGYITVPILLGPKTAPIIHLLPYYAFGMACFTLASSIVTYHQVRKEYLFSFVSFLLGLVQIAGMGLIHANVSSVAYVVSATGSGLLATMVFLHVFYHPISVFISNIRDLFDLFRRVPQPAPNSHIRILIFNWRDTQHVWAGGAEVYVHELAKRWVGDGHKVTLFCGNDTKHARNEVMDGVQIVRRGGLYTVYIWAFLYYIFRFRGRYDIVIDSENGIPFFTPLYSRVPAFLLIHHVHQEVFRERLQFPFSAFASFLESTCMPLTYRNSQVVTVSQSSKKDIVSHKLAKENNIHIIHPGVAANAFVRTAKKVSPTFLYLGRLKAYKNIDIAIRAFARVLRKYPKARLIIAGEGEQQKELIALAKHLRIAKAVSFLGRVSEEKKKYLFASSWAALQLSSHEGWGISVIEANASGTPVIASNINGLKDSVVNGQTGILVQLKHATQTAQAMELIITDRKLRKKLSAEAYEWSKSFSWDKSAQDYIGYLSQASEAYRLGNKRQKFLLAKVQSENL